MIEDKFTEHEALAQKEWPPDLNLWKKLMMGNITAIRKTLADGAPDTPLNELAPNMFARIARARLEGKPIIMYPFSCGPELFYAMDLEPFMQETLSVGMSPFRWNEPYLDMANQMGYGDNPTICNAQRPLIAAVESGDVPKSDLLFYISTPCNSMATSYEVYQYVTGIPTFTVDLPYWSSDSTSEFYDDKTVDYVKKQLRDCIAWLEQQTGHKFDPEKFQQTMARVNEARENIMEFNELLKAVPCPVNSLNSVNNYQIMTLSGGTQEAVDLTRWMRDYAEENVKNGIAGVPGEKLRIAWPYLHVACEPGLLPWVEETFDAVAIMNILGHYTVPPHDVSSLEKCFDSLAIGTMDYSMIDVCRGPAEYFTDYLVRFIGDYKIDCVIIPMQFACKHTYAITKLAAEAVQKEAGIPVLIFGHDPFDYREMLPEVRRGKIEEFITEIVL